MYQGDKSPDYGNPNEARIAPIILEQIKPMRDAFDKGDLAEIRNLAIEMTRKDYVITDPNAFQNVQLPTWLPKGESLRKHDAFRSDPKSGWIVILVPASNKGGLQRPDGVMASLGGDGSDRSFKDTWLAVNIDSDKGEIINGMTLVNDSEVGLDEFPIQGINPN